MSQVSRGEYIGNGIVSAILIVGLIIGFVLWQNGVIRPDMLINKKVYKTMKVGNATIDVQTAKTPEEQVKSLNGLKSIRENEGMLFVFAQDGKYSISTSQMLFPIDILWIDKDGNIVDTQSNIAPGLRDPIVPWAYARYVLLVNAGFMDRYEIVNRMSVTLPVQF